MAHWSCHRPPDIAVPVCPLRVCAKHRCPYWRDITRGARLERIVRHIEALRYKARAAHDWHTADRLRRRMLALGITPRDERVP